MDISEHSTKSDPKGIFELCLPKTYFFPKINRDHVAYNVFDLQKNFHDDRLSFPVYGEKINLGHFRPFLRPTVLKVQNFCQNWSSRAKKLATSLFLYGESEKIGLEMICRPPRFQHMRFFLTTTLKLNFVNVFHNIQHYHYRIESFKSPKIWIYSFKDQLY